jgi:hypothetical protein
MIDECNHNRFKNLIPEKENYQPIVNTEKKIINFENGCVYEGDWDEK